MMVIMMMSTITNIIICLDLLAIGIGLPESDTVLLGHVPALGQQLRVRDRLLALRRKVNNQNVFVQFVEKRPKNEVTKNSCTWVQPCSTNFLAVSLVSVNCCGSCPDLHSL